MTSLNQKYSKQFLGAGVRVVTLVLFLMVFGAGAALAQTRGYLTNSGSSTVSVIDPATNAVVATVPVGSVPTAVAVAPNGAFAYIVNQASNNVSVISAASNTVVATVAVGTQPIGIAITPNGAFAYVANFSSNNLSVISTATNTVVGTIAVGDSQRAVIFTPNGAFAYVTLVTGPVAVINTAINAVVATVNVGASVTQSAGTPAIDPSGTAVYVPVAAFFNEHVSVISTATNAVVATIPLGPFTFPSAIGFATPTHGPTNKDECKDGGWQTFTNPTFKNQGQCIKFVNHMDQ
jgi:YVTN family beta-propeller protein